MSNIYTTGEYLKTTQSWHVEDSAWKALQIFKIMKKNHIQPKKIVEIGCGAGQVIKELSQYPSLKESQFKGYDISSHAIQLCKTVESDNLKFFCRDPLNEDFEEFTESFDILLMIDVFEHIPDYMGFLEKAKLKASYKIYHIPLDLHVSSVFRNSFIRNRYSIGHLHYFTADSAINTLTDTGHEILDCCYTNAAIELFRQNPSASRAIANVPRWLFSKINLDFTVRIFGGYSLLVLTK